MAASPLRFYDFFAGAGLARLGLGDPWMCSWANDIDPGKREVYEQNFGGEHFHPGDIAEVDPGSLPLPGDMAWASFPCQDLSLAGWRRGMSATRSGTFWAFWRIMDALGQGQEGPPLVVVENVVGLLYGDNFSGLCEALAGLGMQFGALVMDAKHFLPQSRPRVFVVAVDAGVDVSAWCHDGLTPTSCWETKALVRAVGRLPEDVAHLWRQWRLPVPMREVPRLQEVIDREPIGWIDWHATAETDRLLGMMTETNRAKIGAALAGRRRAVGALYKRMRGGVQRAEVRFDGLSGCLRTPHGGSSRETIVEVRDGRVRTRLITPRECARLMGVSDGYWLPDAYNAAYRAMGDAVAVPVVDWLSRHLLAPLASHCREYRRARPRKRSRTAAPSDLRKRVEFRASDWEKANRCLTRK